MDIAKRHAARLRNGSFSARFHLYEEINPCKKIPQNKTDNDSYDDNTQIRRHPDQKEIKTAYFLLIQTEKKRKNSPKTRKPSKIPSNYPQKFAFFGISEYN